MTYEEALKIMKIGKKMSSQLEEEEAHYYFSNMEEATDIAIEALEKQIPKKPKVRGYGIHDEEYDDYHEETRYYCPTCVARTGILDGETEIPCGIGKKRGRDSHCNRCGQAIDWSD